MDMGEIWQLDFGEMIIRVTIIIYSPARTCAPYGEKASFPTDIFPLCHRHNNRFHRR